MEFLTGFLLGLMTGVGMFVGYGVYQVRKFRQAKTKITEEIKKKIDELDGKRDSIRERLIKAQELTQQQLELRAQAEMPSKNAIHSRYKNGLIGEIGKLEEEKIVVLQSILNDGYDPTVTILDEKGNKQELPLSHFVSSAKLKQDDRNGVPPTAGPDGNIKRIGKFVVVKGGKDDGTVH